MKKTMKKLLLILAVIVVGIGTFIIVENNREVEAHTSDTLRVTVTTTFLGDLVHQIGGDKVEVTTLMGPGIDPHQYQASSSDLDKLMGADVIFFGGLHLEAKLAEILEKLEDSDIESVDTSRSIPREKLILADPNDESLTGTYDPHIWFDIDIWKMVAEDVTETLASNDPENRSYYEHNKREYFKELDELARYVKARVAELPEEKQYLITAHDAFNYFGAYTGMTVQGIQGFNTVVEAGTSDVSETATLIIDHDVKAVFVESTISPKLVQALQEAVRAKGKNVEIGGELYSDSTGNGGTPEATYVGMYYHNIDTIVDSLL